MAADFLAKIRLALEGNKKVVDGLNEVHGTALKLTKAKIISPIFDKKGLKTGQQIQQTFAKIKPPAKKMNDFTKALRRVAVVAPIWMAFRAVMRETMAILRDGFKTWEEFDRALIKSKAVIHDYAGTTEEAMKVLESSIRSFSKESGIALKDLTSAFYRFGTVGIAFTDAMSGAIASAKLAKSTFADVDTIARSMAMTYRLLGDTIESTLSPMEKQESLAGKILHLWKTNAFEANEFAGSLNNFISTANIANFTADQTVAILGALGTAGVKGARGGRLLRTSIQKLVDNLDKLAPTLGLAVNPELETTFELLMRVMGEINKLSKVGGIPVEAIKTISEIFGGVRGGQVIGALNALLPELRQNLINMGKDPQVFIKELNARHQEVLNTVSGQIDIFRELRKQMGEAFVKGVLGAEDFKTSLKDINSIMEQLIIIGGSVGNTLYRISHPIGTIKKEFKEIQEEASNFSKRIDDAIAGNLSLKDSIETIVLIQQKYEKGAYTESLIDRIRKVSSEIIKMGAMQERINKVIMDYNENTIQAERNQIAYYNELSVSLQNRLALAKTELEIIALQGQGISDTVIEYKKMDNLVKVLVDRYNSLDLEEQGLKPISKMVIQSALLEGNFSKILDTFKGMTITEKEMNALAKAYVDTNKSVLKQLQAQDKAIKSQYITYEKADEFEKGRLRRLMELLGMGVPELTKEFEEGGFDKKLIVEYWSSFSQQGRSAINDVIQELYDLPQLKVPTMYGKLPFTPEHMPNIVQSVVGASIQEVNINLPDIDFRSLAEKAGEVVTEKIKSDPQYQKLIANSIRGEI